MITVEVRNCNKMKLHSTNLKYKCSDIVYRYIIFMYSDKQHHTKELTKRELGDKVSVFYVFDSEYSDIDKTT